MFSSRNIAKFTATAAVASAILLAALQPSAALPHESSYGAPPKTVNGVSLSDYLGSPAYWAKLKQFAVKYERALGPCRTAEVNRRYKALPAKHAYKVPRLGTPPQWIEILNIEGCKTPYRRGVVVFLIKGQPKFMPILHGTSKADPFLQVDVMRMLLPAARAQASKKNCANAKDVRILGAKLTTETRTNMGPVWNETWRIADCRGVKDYTVRFAPSPRGGTTIRISSL